MNWLIWKHRQVHHGGHGPYTFYNFTIGIEFLPYKLTLLSFCAPSHECFLIPCNIQVYGIAIATEIQFSELKSTLLSFQLYQLHACNYTICSYHNYTPCSVLAVLVLPYVATYQFYHMYHILLVAIAMHCGLEIAILAIYCNF